MQRQVPRWLQITLLLTVAGVCLGGCVTARPGATQRRSGRPGQPQSPKASSAAAATPRSPSPDEVMDFTPVGARTAWAVAIGNRLHNPAQAVLLTADGGVRWSNVTPPRLRRAGRRTAISDLDVRSARRAWLVYGPLTGGHATRPRLLRTSDGGRTWTRAGSTPAFCDVQFVDPRDGWCVSLQGATGSMFAAIYRTTDGGRGRQRRHPAHAGGRADGRRDVVGYSVQGYRHTPTSTVLFISRDGGLRWSKLRPPVAHRRYDVDLVSARVWRLAAGSKLLSTSDGGRTWERLTASANLTRARELWFTTPSAGWDLDLASGQVVLHTRDGGADWSAVRDPQP